MKLFFLDDDNLHKIFKTLQKVPTGKHVTCFVEADNAIFNNERRGRQIKQLIIERKLHITRIAKTTRQKEFFEQTGLTYTYVHRSARSKNLALLQSFFFKKTNLNKLREEKPKIVRTIIIGAELVGLMLLAYVLYILVLPSATITITPNYTLQDIVYNFRYYPQTNNLWQEDFEQLSIPYYKGQFTSSISASTNVANVVDAQTPARGTITVYNTTDIPYDIIPGTRFITDDGLYYTADTGFSLPARISDQTPGQVTISVTAMQTDIMNEIIGARGNIEADTMLYIRNIRTSYFLKNIYARANSTFVGGETLSSGSVQNSDITQLQQTMQSQVYDRVQAQIRTEFDVPDAVLLYFDELFEYDILSFETPHFVGEEVSKITGTMTIQYRFPYVLQSDIIQQFQTFINQRESSVEQLIDINLQSLTLYDIRDDRSEPPVYVIPTEITTIQTYNFENDPRGILPAIIDAAAGQQESDLIEYVREYPEISNIDISISPRWFQDIPTTKSRISFDIK
jgi:hypothetical protein